jgi:hypothetical protein
MTFPAVQSSSQGSSTSLGSTHSVTLPSGITAGDLLIILFASSKYSGASDVTASGWTDTDGQGTGSPPSANYPRMTILTRVATGSEGSSVTVNKGTSLWCSWIVYRISGASGLSDVQSSTQSSDPPSSGTVSAGDNLAIAVGMVSDETATVTTWPSGYTSNQITEASTDTSGCVINAATKQFTGTTEDPRGFSYSSGASNGWSVVTIVLTTSAPSGTSGSISGTEGNDSQTSVGSLTLAGSSASSETDDSQTGVGSIVFSGASSATEASDSQTASGSELVLSSSSSIESADASTITGSVVDVVSSASTEANDTATGSSAVGNVGIIVLAESGDSSSSQATIFAASSASESNDTTTATGSFVFAGVISATESGDSSNALGSNLGQSTAIESSDSSIASGSQRIGGNSSATEASDTSSSQSTILGSSTGVESSDSSASSSQITIQSSSASSESSDLSTAIGELCLCGTSSTTEGNDLGSSGSTIIATSSATESSDTSIGTANYVYAGSSATTEQNDQSQASSTSVSGSILGLEGDDSGSSFIRGPMFRNGVPLFTGGSRSFNSKCCCCECCIDRVKIYRGSAPAFTCYIAEPYATRFGCGTGSYGLLGTIACFDETFLLSQQSSSTGKCCATGKWKELPQCNETDNICYVCTVGVSECFNAPGFDVHYGVFCLGYEKEVTLCYTPGGTLSKLRIVHKTYFKAMVYSQEADNALDPVTELTTVEIDELAQTSVYEWYGDSIPLCSALGTLDLGPPDFEDLAEEKLYEWGRPFVHCEGGSHFEITLPAACHATKAELSSTGALNHKCGQGTANPLNPACTAC